MKTPLSAYLMKLGSTIQVIGPLTAGEVRGFEADILLFERKIEPDERGEYEQFLRAVRNSPNARVAVLVAAPKRTT